MLGILQKMANILLLTQRMKLLKASVVGLSVKQI